MTIRTASEIWIRRGCAVVVAAVTAYASYEHQRAFVLHDGAPGSRTATKEYGQPGMNCEADFARP
ncbi:hypothetical protein [Streptomyces synnematoformans]|uniref:Uncharacterized protein n=1 Tax=Streptomyces synnematoformans TaxID=415721 RepID=A0ABP5IYM6_9ACTN